MTEYKTLHDIIWSIPPKLTRPTQRKDVFWYHQPYLNIYDVLTDGGNRIQYVDLGLPSGLLWADRNLGASSPEDFGDGYAWGEVQTKTTFTWDNYKYGTANTLTKYCNDSNKGLNGYTDALTELEDTDDAIQVNSTGYMPNSEQVQELIENTTQEWTTLNGVPGVKFTGQNGNSIFIPATINDESGFIWSTSLNESDADQAYGLSFIEDQVTLDLEDRYTGQSVRARGVITKSDLMIDTILTIEATQDNTRVIFKVENETKAKTIEVSVNDGRTWSSKTASQNGTELAILNAGEKLLIRGNNTSYGYQENNEIKGHRFEADKQCYIYGNVMSLVDKQHFDTAQTVEDLAFPYLFGNVYWYSNSWVLLRDDKPLMLPATTVKFASYYGMFQNCGSITTTPELPAMNLGWGCYNSMFRACSNLTTAPELPATTLAGDCYNSMFKNCGKLTTVTELPATTMEQTCYKSMFCDCGLLTNAPELPATTLANNCYEEMFAGCALTKAPVLKATTLAPGCYKLMFERCTSIVTAPDLLALNPSDVAYQYMFRNCSSLNYIKCTAEENIIGATSNSDWVQNVAANGTFVKSPNVPTSTWMDAGANRIPQGWTIVDAT